MPLDRVQKCFVYSSILPPPLYDTSCTVCSVSESLSPIVPSIVYLDDGGTVYQNRSVENQLLNRFYENINITSNGIIVISRLNRNVDFFNLDKIQIKGGAELKSKLV